MEYSDDVRRSPAYAQFYYAQQKSKMENAQNQQQAQQRAQYTKDNRDTILGKEAQLGLPSQNPALQSQVGTGAFREGIDPREAFQRKRNFALNTSGMPKLEEQGQKNSSAMQNSLMQSVNAAPRKADTQLEQLTQYRNRILAEGGDPTMVDQAIQKAATRSDGIQLSTNPDGSMSFSMGGSGGNDALGLGKTQQGNAEGGIMNAASSIRRLSSAGKKYKDEYMGLAADLKGWAGSWQDRLMGSGKLAEYNAARGSFRRDVKQVFNDYKVEITGAAASDKEMQMLMDSIVNEDLGPLEFKAAYDQFMSQAIDNIELNTRAKGGDVRGVLTQLGLPVVQDDDGQWYVKKPGENAEWTLIREK